jgi:hypothetical protein
VAGVAGGSAFLAAPFLIQPLPARLRDSTMRAVPFAAAGLGLLLALPLPSLPFLLCGFAIFMVVGLWIFPEPCTEKLPRK